MNLEEKAKQYGDTFWSNQESAKEDFEAGAKWLREEIKDFIKANPKITADQITEYLNSL